MWKSLGEGILKYKFLLLGILLAVTIFMGWQASQVKLSYEFGKAIPTDNPKYIAYQEFKKKFGEDGNLLLIGIQTNDLFQKEVFNDYSKLYIDIKKIEGVENIIAVPAAVNLIKNYETEKLEALPIFRDTALTQKEIDSSAAELFNLPFYNGLLYNKQTGAWLMGVGINKDILATSKRKKVVNDIIALANDFGERHKLEMHLSGLPLIRTVMASRVEKEMQWFTFISIGLSAIILLIFFRSISATVLSLAVVVIGVICCFGTIHLLGYKITLLTALIAPLIVVIGIPNCIYFLNKYHTAFNETRNKKEAIILMISKMGIITLFCNIAAAIGFAVFALTSSEILKEFGIVAGINIMGLFFISLVLIPVAVSVLPPPKERHTKYLHNASLQRWLVRLERWSLNHRKLIYAVSAGVILISLVGMWRLKSVGYIVDDLPKTDKIYTDLKFFEKNFKGVMPLEIVIDTKKPNGLRGARALVVFNKMDTLSGFIASMPEMSRPLSIIEGLKFSRQAFFEGDSTYYSMPSEYDLPGLQSYLTMRNKDSNTSGNSFSKIISTFMDKEMQQARLSVSMQDVGSARLPEVLQKIEQKTTQLFDTSVYKIQLTGTSVTFLEGSSYIINGLKESILWAFLLIAACMLYLFRSLRILICSLLPNLIPLVITAGVMGWVGVPLKPSTVLVFSVALGIAIDVTIRFLVTYKQEISSAVPSVRVIKTIHSAGLSIIYTSIVLTAGFVIFCFSSFGGTQALGWLTSLTLVTATMANLIVLPALLITMGTKGIEAIDEQKKN